MKHKVFLSLGSNVGDRMKNLEQGINFLTENNNVELVLTSNIYETEPMYNKDQDDYYNLIIEVRTVLSPAELLGFIKLIELKSGRRISQKRNLPRVLDIDILTIDDIVMESPGLVLPHPNIQERRFVLEPWAEIAPEFVVPAANKTVKELMIITNDNSKVTMLEEESAPAV